jgi:hypothetical protein
MSTRQKKQVGVCHILIDSGDCSFIGNPSDGSKKRRRKRRKLDQAVSGQSTSEGSGGKDVFDFMNTLGGGGEVGNGGGEAPSLTTAGATAVAAATGAVMGEGKEEGSGQHSAALGILSLEEGEQKLKQRLVSMVLEAV